MMISSSQPETAEAFLQEMGFSPDEYPSTVATLRVDCHHFLYESYESLQQEGFSPCSAECLKKEALKRFKRTEQLKKQKNIQGSTPPTYLEAYSKSMDDFSLIRASSSLTRGSSNLTQNSFYNMTFDDEELMTFEAIKHYFMGHLPEITPNVLFGACTKTLSQVRSFKDLLLFSPTKTSYKLFFPAARPLPDSSLVSALAALFFNNSALAAICIPIATIDSNISQVFPINTNRPVFLNVSMEPMLQSLNSSFFLHWREAMPITAALVDMIADHMFLPRSVGIQAASLFFQAGVEPEATLIQHLSTLMEALRKEWLLFVAEPKIVKGKCMNGINPIEAVFTMPEVKTPLFYLPVFDPSSDSTVVAEKILEEALPIIESSVSKTMCYPPCLLIDLSEQPGVVNLPTTIKTGFTLPPGVGPSHEVTLSLNTVIQYDSNGYSVLQSEYTAPYRAQNWQRTGTVFNMMASRVESMPNTSNNTLSCHAILACYILAPFIRRNKPELYHGSS